jgi:hypothetical protein
MRVNRRGQRIRDIEEDSHLLLVRHGGRLVNRTGDAGPMNDSRLDPRGKTKMMQIQTVGRDLCAGIEAKTVKN